MIFDRDAALNPGRFLAALVVEELRRHGLGLVVACPGARNQPLLAAVAARPDLDCRIAVDERAAGHLALGWLRGRAAEGAAPALAAVVTTSGTAPLLVIPALAEARAMALPLVLLSADRPAELHQVGANQTLDQLSPVRPFVVAQHDLACHEGGASPRTVLAAVAEAASAALTAPQGPIQINLALREPLAPDPAPLGEGWTDAVADWANDSAPYATRVGGLRGVPAAALARLRDELGRARRPIVWVAGLERAADRRAALAIAAQSGAPWLADAGSGLRLAPAQPHRLAHAEFYADELARADLVLQLGRRPVSLRVGKQLSHARRWLVDDHPERQDPWRQGGERLGVTAAELETALAGVPLAAGPDPAWRSDLLDRDAAWRTRLARRIDESGEFAEAWVGRELGRRLPAACGLFTGNSLAVRHLDTIADPSGPGAVTFTSRGTSGIEGLVAQAVGIARGSGRPLVALLGDLTVLHDLGSLALVARERAPLCVVAIQNRGGAIFRQLPGGRHPRLLEPWLVADQQIDLAAAAAALGVTSQRVGDRAAFSRALDLFLAAPAPRLVEAVVDPAGHARLLADLDREVRR
ncbi:MAG TPA: 2-succinyl-5-enolpyruvyl-6-hydroxy-3-cyclohexene-1-carboxylic-acid synthase [Candidatus Krumholzibacteria bacterium]|nr:2-succinyl-5-enolpyruvyl-6-hydroxy-3-cyclohexene-1-carboxylic-acid synthase [Candidatus Krumholzibacteria bacterium]HPD70303.1 2-succinyl-5-enolpyruvyl-6-hydroxy-3-cyclohexene-1-carboxylic-acid synthase [Candidatus Krumholzibacteria bacterium]HRY39997.1 2-succinyl-5-enolpyruvyl-6-hydroxy-3-cyclohexene-1-carboxylic-acid synthase [Candidatus Krumholzibacteria bacterium]